MLIDSEKIDYNTKNFLQISRLFSLKKVKHNSIYVGFPINILNEKKNN